MSTNSNSKLKMADHIPIEIQAEIIKHLPIKSLIRCTLLSKLLNAIIKSSTFITDHSVRHNQQHYLLARYETNLNREFQQNHVSIIDNDNDDNFPQNKFLITVPETVNRINPMCAFVLSSSRGLLCLFHSDNIDHKCFIWNPSIRRCIVIPIPNALRTVVGLRVCPYSSDPKLVKLRGYGNSPQSDNSNSVNWGAQVYTVSSGVWKSIPIDKPRKQISLGFEQIVINGIIYFDTYDSSKTRNGHHRQIIITFDLTSEKIGEVYLPDSLAHLSRGFFLSKRMESLVVIDDYTEGEEEVCDVWIMKHGVPNSFEKRFTFKAPKHSYIRVLGFRKNGEPILLRSAPSKGDRLEVYTPCSEQFTNLEVYGSGNEMMVVTANSLTETLLLIDQPNTILIDDDDTDDNDNDD